MSKKKKDEVKTEEAKPIERFRMVLNVIGINIDYSTAELIYRAWQLNDARGGELTLSEITDLRDEHRKRLQNIQEAEQQEQQQIEAQDKK